MFTVRILYHVVLGNRVFFSGGGGGLIWGFLGIGPSAKSIIWAGCDSEGHPLVLGLY